MALDADEVVIAGNGAVYVAPADTPLPADIETALNAAFIEVGYLSEDGVTFRDAKTTGEVSAWQALYAIRRYVESKEGGLEMVLRQWNEENMKLAFGGGTMTHVTGPPAYHKYHPPAPEDIDYRAMVVEFQDGAEEYRIVVPRGMVTSEIEAQLARTTPADLPITFDFTPEGRPTPGSDATQPWYFVSNAAQYA